MSSAERSVQGAQATTPSVLLAKRVLANAYQTSVQINIILTEAAGGVEGSKIQLSNVM